MITFPSLLLFSRYMKSCCVDSCATADTKNLTGNADKSGVRHQWESMPNLPLDSQGTTFPLEHRLRIWTSLGLSFRTIMGFQPLLALVVFPSSPSGFWIFLAFLSRSTTAHQLTMTLIWGKSPIPFAKWLRLSTSAPSYYRVMFLNGSTRLCLLLRRLGLGWLTK